MTEQTRNHLQNATSPYLKSAAHQPVEWHTWGAEALERARKENKPILLDIGAVWCHWCHVMDRESYESAEVAEIINQHFVPIKVDRDERPDIDARYQAAVAAISGQGGWPLTAFLTPEGKTFFGGTYFPPEDQMGRPGLKRVLAAIAGNFHTRRAEIESSANQLIEALNQSETFSGAKRTFHVSAVDGIVDSALRLFDIRHGGFGTAPKFPHPAALELLLERYQSSGESYLRTVLVTTLNGMARGGVYDHLAGGFHRYSVDERWHVPHFEKMSYDNSELLKSYLHGYQVFGNPFYRQVAEGIIGWVHTTLSDPEQGGFYASQDADYNLEDDGDYFTWTLDEVGACLPAAEAEFILAHYGVGNHGPMHHNPAKNVLHVARSFEGIAQERGAAPEEVEQKISAAKQKMLEARRQRPTPYVDKTLYVSWNAMFISAYLEAFRVLGRDDCRELALRTLNRLLEGAWSARWGFAHRCADHGTLPKEEWLGGVLDDQAFMAHALLDAFEVTGDKGFFDRAEETMRLCLTLFWDDKEGGFFDRPRTAPPITAATDVLRKPIQDSPTPGGNAVAAMALERLHGYTQEESYRNKARETLEVFAGLAERFGLFASSYGLACLLHDRQPVQIVIVGDRKDARTQALGRAAQESFRFGKAVLQYEPGMITAGRLPKGLDATLPHLEVSRPVGLVCGQGSCHPPVSRPEELQEAIASIAG